ETTRQPEKQRMRFSRFSGRGGARIEDRGSRIEGKAFDPRSSILDPRSSILVLLTPSRPAAAGLAPATPAAAPSASAAAAAPASSSPDRCTGPTAIQNPARTTAPAPPSRTPGT